jgi:hypothetical protein
METTSLLRIRPLGGPWAFFKRLRILRGGQLIEDIADYNRVHQMFSVLSSSDSRINDMGEGFGVEFDIRDKNERLGSDNGDYTTNILSGIGVNDAQTVLFKPLSGLLNQPKFIPLRYCPLTIELDLVETLTEPIATTTLAGGGPADPEITQANTGTKWQIENVQVKVDLCTLDNELENTYAKHRKVETCQLIIILAYHNINLLSAAWMVIIFLSGKKMFKYQLVVQFYD